MLLHENKEDQAWGHGHHDSRQGMFPVRRLCGKLHIKGLLNVHGFGIAANDQLVGDDIIPYGKGIQNYDRGQDGL